MRVRNETPFPYQVFLWTDGEGRDFASAVVKATCSLSTGAASSQQQRIELADVLSPTGAITTPADVAPRRTATSVVVKGSVWAPGGRPATQVHARVSVGRLERRLIAFGERRWTKSGGRLSPSPPAAFDSVAATLDNAFGGVTRRERFAANPIGRGLVSDVSEAEGVELPRLEDPEAPIQSPSDRPTPVALDAVPATFAPRLGRAGTYDDAWKTSRAPLLPDDFDERYFDVAQDALAARPFFVGNEPIVIEGLHPDGPIHARVPRIPVRIDVGRSRSLPRLDLIVLEPASDSITLTFRRTYDVTEMGSSYPPLTILQLNLRARAGAPR